jgi:RNA polymerase sigma-70 factor (ECF subfamily)
LVDNPTYNEQELVEALRSRQEEAFRYLYDHYSGALYGIVKQIIIDPEISNDVLQEVFINIWRRIESYDPAKGRLFTWMLNIARNASIDMLRSKGFQNSQKNQDLSKVVDNNMPSQVVLPETDHIGLKKVLAKLKVEHRVLIELAYFKGYTQEEIAQIEGIPLGTVKTRIRNALVQLREYIK